MYVNGGAAPSISWSSIPTSTWTHVHLETDVEIRDPMTIMALAIEEQVEDGQDFAGNLKGQLAEVYLWSRPLQVLFAPSIVLPSSQIPAI